jgi:zinc transport system substrate-binding protein
MIVTNKNERMKNILVSISLILLLILCQPAKQSDKVVLSVSILPQKFFIEQLIGDTVPINVMVPPGASPATYAPTNKQVKALHQSVAYFKIGHIGFEHAWEPKLKAVNPDMNWFDVSEGIELITGKPIKHGDHVHAGGIDPHIWTSPTTVTQLVKNTSAVLMELFPDAKNEIQENTHRLLEEITKLDEKYNQLADESPKLTFMIYHPAYTYLARDYGFEQLAIEHLGKSPSVGRLKASIQQAREHQVKAIFVQKEFDKTNAEVIAREIDAQIIEVNPLNENWLEEMYRLLELLKKADDV